MTVIAWDGTTLAADRMVTSGVLSFATTKIFSLEHEVIGVAGDSAHSVALYRWRKSGADIEKYPKPIKEDDFAKLIVINKDGLFESGGASPYLIKNENKMAAYGCGAEMALMAMSMGKTAKEAVIATCELNVFCGMGVDAIDVKFGYK